MTKQCFFLIYCVIIEIVYTEFGNSLKKIEQKMEYYQRVKN